MRLAVVTRNRPWMSMDPRQIPADLKEPSMEAGQPPESVMGSCEPVGGLEIADRLGVRRETVAQWKQRGLLPVARWTVSGEGAWDWALDIEPWARATGRLPRAHSEHEGASEIR